MTADWTNLLARWSAAGLIDDATAARIRTFEQEHAGSTRLRWPMLVALAFGALMIAGGILLFVAAHWDALAPRDRFLLVLVLAGAFHIFGALAADRFAGMAGALHAIGTIVLGAGIFLAGQIFNLDEHWPGGLMLWALGAALAWALLRQTPQMILTALLAPAWLAGEWISANNDRLDDPEARVLACGIFLLSLAYFTAVGPGRPDERRRSLMVLGAIALVPAALLVAMVSLPTLSGAAMTPAASPAVNAVGWTTAIGLPLIVAVALRRIDAWPNVVAAVWTLVLFRLRFDLGDISLYAWWALGATALVAWGVRDGRSERVNMGAVIFAATVIAFYFSEVMDKLGRSASLIGLGVLFLAGGWALERTRRRLVMRAKESA
jgi:Predicted membrane protein (DUF2157)